MIELIWIATLLPLHLYTTDHSAKKKISLIERFLNVSDIMVNIIFTLEFLLKIVVVGCRGYFQSSWNILNLFIVVTSDLEMIL